MAWVKRRTHSTSLYSWSKVTGVIAYLTTPNEGPFGFLSILWLGSLDGGVIGSTETQVRGSEFWEVCGWRLRNLRFAPRVPASNPRGAS